LTKHGARARGQGASLAEGERKKTVGGPTAAIILLAASRLLGDFYFPLFLFSFLSYLFSL
jgi:hypothetical protein